MKIVYVLAAVILVGVLSSWFWWNKIHTTPPQSVHLHAGFQIYVNGVLQDYSADKFMKIEACQVNSSVASNNPIDRAHLHDNIGDVVHVHQPGATWGDLFQNLNLTFDSTATLSAYVNSQPVDNVFNELIKPYDSLVLLVGQHKDPAEYLATQVTREHILKVEQTKESCGLP